MKVRFLYVDSDGREIQVPSMDAFSALVESGEIGEETLLFDALSKDWAPARVHQLFRLAAEERQSDGGDDGADLPESVELSDPLVDAELPDATQAFLEEVERERQQSELNPGSTRPDLPVVRDEVVSVVTAASDRDSTAPDLSATDLSEMALVEIPGWQGETSSPPRRRPRQVEGEPGRRVALVGALLMIGGWGIADAWATDPVLPPDEEVLVMESRVASNAYTAEGALRIRESAQGAFSDMTAGMARIQARLGVGAPPTSWLSGEYLSDPASVPEVLQFWGQYEALVDSLRSAEEQLFRTGFVTRLQAQGITGSVLSIRLARAMGDFRDDAARRAQIYDAMDGLAREARELDDFLRASEGRIAFAGVRSGALSLEPTTEAIPLDEGTRLALDRHLDELFTAMDAVTGTDPTQRRDLTGNVLASLRGGR